MRLIFLVLSLLMVAPALAQGNNSVAEQIAAMNRIPPLQNPQYERSAKVLDRKVQDKKNKVVGHVEDIIVHKTGSIQSLAIEFDRLQIAGVMHLNYGSAGLKPGGDSFMISLYDSDEIETLLPTFLADMDTAAGGEDILSVEKLKGAAVKTPNGDTLGSVDEILFSKKGDQVQALLMNVNYKTINSKRVALPIAYAGFRQNMGRQEIVLNTDTSKAVLDYAALLK